MSKEMADKKAADIAALEEEEQEILEETKQDMCPVCGLPTGQLEFLNPQLLKMFGWVECTRCGLVYSPRSVLNRKRLFASGVVPVTEMPAEEPSKIIKL